MQLRTLDVCLPGYYHRTGAHNKRYQHIQTSSPHSDLDLTKGIERSGYYRRADSSLTIREMGRYIHLLRLLGLICSLTVVASVLAQGKTATEERKKFPNRSTEPVLRPDSLKIVAELPHRPGNLDVDPKSGRVFFTFHPFGNPNPPCKVCELKEKFEGFEPFGNQELFKTVLSVRVAATKRQLLAVDHKNFGEVAPVLYVLSLDTEELVKAFEFPSEVCGKGSFLNDFVISKDENFVFIADSGLGGEPSIITVDLRYWTAKRALVNHESTKQRDTPKDFAINGNKYEFSFKVGVDSIALSADGNTLYFGALFDP